MSEISIVLLLFAAVIVLFVTEIIPLALTSLFIPVVLVLTGVLDTQGAFAGFINNNVILFTGMFVIGDALFQTGMANEIGKTVTKYARTERQLIILLMVVAGVMSGFLSNTGTAAVLIPVILGIAAKSGFSRSKLLLPMVLASAMGGNLSLIGAPGNMIAQSALNEHGLSFGFFEYGLVGVPILIVGIIYFALVGYKFLPETQTQADLDHIQEDDFSHVPKWHKTVSLLVLIATVLAMIFEDQIGIPLHISSTIGALFLVLVGVMSEKQAYDSIDLSTIFLFGGTLALGTAIDQSGAGVVIAERVIGLLGDNASPRLLLAMILLLSMVLTNFMSNTASTALLVPISLQIASTMGADPRAVVMATVIGASCAYATPIGMPANTMIYGIGGYKFTDYTKAGLPLMVLAFIVSMILLPIFFPFYP